MTIDEKIFFIDFKTDVENFLRRQFDKKKHTHYNACRKSYFMFRGFLIF